MPVVKWFSLNGSPAGLDTRPSKTEPAERLDMGTIAEEHIIVRDRHWKSVPRRERQDLTIYKNGFGIPPSEFFDGTLLCGQLAYTTYAGQPATSGDMAFAALGGAARLCD